MDSENAQEKYNEIKDNIVNFRGKTHIIKWHFLLYSFLDFIKNYSDVDMKPKIPIKFCDIMPISAKESSSDILKVKQRLRNLLDVMADLENENEDNTYPDIKNALKEKTPVLVWYN